MANRFPFSVRILWIIAAAVLIAAVVLAVFVIKGSAKPRAAQYRVDYCGGKDCFEGARDAYPAGEQVTLYYPYVATDTNYSFYLDGEPLKFEYEAAKGIVIRFTMPEHDVRLECSEQNSMEYVPEE